MSETWHGGMYAAIRLVAEGRIASPHCARPPMHWPASQCVMLRPQANAHEIHAQVMF